MDELRKKIEIIFKEFEYFNEADPSGFVDEILKITKTGPPDLERLRNYFSPICNYFAILSNTYEFELPEMRIIYDSLEQIENILKEK